jgi:deazaflavin-dependent oxidoreductase (nitroreductase family)
MSAFDFKQKPTGAWRWFLHAPTWLYRAHLGFLMGKRMLMIEHRGRRSGALYRTVLEVAGRGEGTDTYIVTSGTGVGADWYRNLRAGGLDGVWIGATRHMADVRYLDSTEAGGVFETYETDHPRAASVLMEKMGVSHDGSDAGRVQMMDQIPMLEFSVQ